MSKLIVDRCLYQTVPMVDEATFFAQAPESLTKSRKSSQEKATSKSNKEEAIKDEKSDMENVDVMMMTTDDQEQPVVDPPLSSHQLMLNRLQYEFLERQRWVVNVYMYMHCLFHSFLIVTPPDFQFVPT